MLAGLAAVMVVAGGVYYYFNDVDVPPTLSFGGAGVQGMLEDGEQGFLEYEDGDEADYKDFISGYKDDNVDAEVMRLHSGVNNVYVPEEISVEDLSKCIDPEAGRVLFAQWDAKEGSFMVYPEGPFAETTTVDTDYKFKKGSGLVVISRHSADSWCLAAADTKSSVAVVAPMAADQDGWVLLPSNNGKVADFIEPFNDRVLKVWKMVGDNEFERVREADYDENVGDYYLLWLKLAEVQEVAREDHYVPENPEVVYKKIDKDHSQIVFGWDKVVKENVNVQEYSVLVYQCDLLGQNCDHSGYYAQVHRVPESRPEFYMVNPEPGKKYYFKVAAKIEGREVVAADYTREISVEVPAVVVVGDPAGDDAEDPANGGNEDPVAVVYPTVTGLIHEIRGSGAERVMHYTWNAAAPIDGGLVSYDISVSTDGGHSWLTTTSLQVASYDFPLGERHSTYAKVKVHYIKGQVVFPSEFSDVDIWNEDMDNLDGVADVANGGGAGNVDPVFDNGVVERVGIGEVSHSVVESVVDGSRQVRFFWNSLPDSGGENFTYEVATSTDRGVHWLPGAYQPVSGGFAAYLPVSNNEVLMAKVRVVYGTAPNTSPTDWSEIETWWVGAKSFHSNLQIAPNGTKSVHFTWASARLFGGDGALSYVVEYNNDGVAFRRFGNGSIAQASADIPIVGNNSIRFRVKVRSFVDGVEYVSDSSEYTWYAGVANFHANVENDNRIDFSWDEAKPVNEGTVSYVIGLSYDQSAWFYYPPRDTVNFEFRDGVVHFVMPHPNGEALYAKVMAVYHIGGHNYDSAYSDILQAGN